MLRLGPMSAVPYLQLEISGEERERFLANLGERHIMVLRNHGLIVIGETIGDGIRAQMGPRT